MKIDIAEKHPAEDPFYTFDFTKHSLVLGGDLLSSVTSITAKALVGQDDDVTIGTGTVSDDQKKVTAQISGGVDEGEYRITCLALTEGGRTAACIGKLQVEEG